MKFNIIVSLTVACFISFIVGAVIKSLPLLITSASICFLGQLWVINELLLAVAKQDKAIAEFTKNFKK